MWLVARLGGRVFQVLLLPRRPVRLFSLVPEVLLLGQLQRRYQVFGVGEKPPVHGDTLMLIEHATMIAG